MSYDTHGTNHLMQVIMIYDRCEPNEILKIKIKDRMLVQPWCRETSCLHMWEKIVKCVLNHYSNASLVWKCNAMLDAIPRAQYSDSLNSYHQIIFLHI